MRRRVVTSFAIGRAGVSLAAILGGLLAVRVALAQSAESVTIEVGECVKLASPEERLACYERHVESDAQKKRAASPAPTSAPAGEARAPAPAAAPAVPPPSSARAAQAQRRAEPPSKPSANPDEFVATVTTVRETVPDYLLVTLDNGQVWRQTRSQNYKLQPGQHVTLRGTRWGKSYRLTADELSGFIQVERVK
jgi:hypothetical protein